MDVYTGSEEDPINDSADFHPTAHSLLVLQSSGADAPDAVAAQRVLDNLPHVAADDHVPVASGPLEDQILILRVLFDQTLATIPEGAPDSDIAFAAGLEDEPFHVHWLIEPFADFSHEGFPVDRFAACRPRAFRCRLPGACGLFLDCRALGRPCLLSVLPHWLSRAC